MQTFLVELQLKIDGQHREALQLTTEIEEYARIQIASQLEIQELKADVVASRHEYLGLKIEKEDGTRQLMEVTEQLYTSVLETEALRTRLEESLVLRDSLETQLSCQRKEKNAAEELNAKRMKQMEKDQSRLRNASELLEVDNVNQRLQVTELEGRLGEFLTMEEDLDTAREQLQEALDLCDVYRGDFTAALTRLDASVDSEAEVHELLSSTQLELLEVQGRFKKLQGLFETVSANSIEGEKVMVIMKAANEEAEAQGEITNSLLQEALERERGLLLANKEIEMAFSIATSERIILEERVNLLETGLMELQNSSTTKQEQFLSAMNAVAVLEARLIEVESARVAHLHQTEAEMSSLTQSKCKIEADLQIRLDEINAVKSSLQEAYSESISLTQQLSERERSSRTLQHKIDTLGLLNTGHASEIARLTVLLEEECVKTVGLVQSRDEARSQHEEGVDKLNAAESTVRILSERLNRQLQIQQESERRHTADIIRLEEDAHDREKGYESLIIEHTRTARERCHRLEQHHYERIALLTTELVTT
jgi:hypothetical protein